MKTLLLLLALVGAVHGQTLKWEAKPPAQTFAYDYVQLMHAKADAAGNIVVGILYSLANQKVAGQVIWYGSTGKILYSEISETAYPNGVMQVSPVCAYVQMYAFNGDHFIRKYSRRGSEVIFKDTPLADGEYVADFKAHAETPGGNGFFVVGESADHQFTGLKRYSYR